MKKTLISDINAYRKWAWRELECCDSQITGDVEEVLGLIIEHNCWDYNEKNEPIDENGNVMADEAEETVKLEDWVYELKFPVIAVHCFDHSFDRCGDIDTVICDFVSIHDFEAINNSKKI